MLTSSLNHTQGSMMNQACGINSFEIHAGPVVRGLLTVVRGCTNELLLCNTLSHHPDYLSFICIATLEEVLIP